jgi:glucose/arabinose dehydrogenase
MISVSAVNSWMLGAATLVLLTAGAFAEDQLQLQPGNHVGIIGNTLAERMQHSGWLETLLHAQYPDHELVFRNLGYSGDEIDPRKRLRSRDFGTPDQWLAGEAPVPQPEKLSSRDQGKVLENRFERTNTKADVIFAFFGYNESFAGAAGLDDFRQTLESQLKHMLSQTYNGHSTPRIVLFSPIAMEWVGDPNLPTKEHVAQVNGRLAMYTDAMREVARVNGVLFVDLFEPTRAFGEQKTTDDDSGLRPITINGLHLNERGDLWVARQAIEQLVGEHRLAEQGEAWWKLLEPLRAVVNDKNWYWFHRYRVTDGYSTYGDRAFLKFSEGPGGYGDGLSNYSVGQRELEVLDLETSNRDPVVWAAAQGEVREPQQDNFPDFLEVISNKPGPLEGGKHQFFSGEEAISKMTVHDKMKVTLFADESMFPELINPVQMAFDTKGRLWVATWPTYPHWQPTTPMNDSLLILEDTTGDGRADVCKAFADDLHNITGFEFWNGGVLVAQGPDIVFLEDTTGDDRYDVKIRVLHGLDTADTHHTANSFVLDPGGAMYFQEGTFHHTQVESPWGPPRRVANGAVFRYEPRSQKFDVYVSFGFANPHGHVFDRWGQNIVWDGTGAQPYHATLFSGDLDFPRKYARPPQVYQQRTRPCSGTEILSSQHFPAEFQGNLLVANVIGFQGILQYKVSDESSSFSAVEVDPILFSSDPNFRPTDIEMGPDGAIWFIDWHNPIVGHMQHNLRDPSRDKTHGRVYRVTHEEGSEVESPHIAGAEIPALLELLKSPVDRVRYWTRIELSGRPSDNVIRHARQWIEDLSPEDPEFEHHRLEGLWLHQSHNVVNRELLEEVLASPDFRARSAAVRVLLAWRDRLEDPLSPFQELVNDEHPRVRLEAVRALSFFHGEEAVRAAEIAVESLIHPQDPFLTLVLDETMKTLDSRSAGIGN